MEWALGWIILSVLTGVYADNIGRMGLIWGVIACLISPLIAFIILLVIGKDEDNMAVSGGMKKCPFCAELIKREAIKCKHCGEAQTSAEAQSANEKELNQFITAIRKQNTQATKDIL